MEILQITSGTISVRVERLVQDGFVERISDPQDQRGVLVQLTEKALKVFDQMAPIHLANEARLLSALGSEQRDQLGSMLRILLLSFESLPTEDTQHPFHWSSIIMGWTRNIISASFDQARRVLTEKKDAKSGNSVSIWTVVVQSPLGAP